MSTPRTEEEIDELRSVLSELSIAYTSPDLSNDKEAVLMAVEMNGSQLKHASNELRNDKDVVLAAVLQWGDAFRYASSEIQDDREFILEIMKNYHPNRRLSLKNLSVKFRNDKEIVLATIKHTATDELKFASEEIRNNKNIVLVAVKSSPMSLAFASDALKDDKQIVLAAIKVNGYAFRYASKRLRNDKKIVQGAVLQNSDSLKYASRELRNDQDMVYLAMHNRSQDTSKELGEENEPFPSSMDRDDIAIGSSAKADESERLHPHQSSSISKQALIVTDNEVAEPYRASHSNPYGFLESKKFWIVVAILILMWTSYEIGSMKNRVLTEEEKISECKRWDGKVIYDNRGRYQDCVIGGRIQ